MKKLIAVSLTLASLALAGCGGGAPTPATPAAQGDLKAFGESKVGDRQKCPISGEEFTVSDSSPKAE